MGAAMNTRIAQLEALLRRVLEWEPSLPVESGLLDEIAAALQPVAEPQTPPCVDCGRERHEHTPDAKHLCAGFIHPG